MPPITTSFNYQSLHQMDKDTFCQDILRSGLFGSVITNADEYADLFDEEVTRILDVHAPLRTGRCSGQHNCHSLSDEARQAKQLHRRLERPYRRTGLQS